MTCSVRYGALLICALALAACDRDRATDRDRTTKTDPGTTTVTGANVVANDPAVLRVVNARCARELGDQERELQQPDRQARTTRRL